MLQGDHVRNVNKQDMPLSYVHTVQNIFIDNHKLSRVLNCTVVKEKFVYCSSHSKHGNMHILSISLN